MINAEKLAEEFDNEAKWNSEAKVESSDKDIDYWREMQDPGAHSYSDAASVSTISSHDEEGNENKNKIKSRFGTTYKNDKGYFKIKRGKGKDKLTGFSTLYYPGSTIRNASTGFYENDYMGVPVYRVGCQDEDLFFKDSFQDNGISEEPRCLFYDNPDQCERHLKTTISNDVKERWTNKYNFALEREQKRKDLEYKKQNKYVEVK